MKAREATGLPIVSELMDEAHIDEFEEYVDIVQIGARNMQNFQLLKAVGKMQQAHPAQARSGQHHRGVDHDRRIHHGRRQ